MENNNGNLDLIIEAKGKGAENNDKTPNFLEYMEMLRGDGTWYKLAQSTGVSRSMITRILKGERPLNEEVAKKLTEPTPGYIPNAEISSDELLRSYRDTVAGDMGDLLKSLDSVKDSEEWKAVADKAGISELLIERVKTGNGTFKRLMAYAEKMNEMMVREPLTEYSATGTDDSEGTEQPEIIDDTGKSELEKKRDIIEHVMRNSEKPIRSCYHLPEEERKIFDKAVSDWIYDDLSHNVKLKPCEPSEVKNHDIFRPDYAAVEKGKGKGECIFRYIFSDPKAEENGEIGYRQFAPMHAKKCEPRNNDVWCYVNLFVRDIMKRALFSEYDPKRRLVIVTNSKTLFELMWNDGKSISYAGNLFIMCMENGMIRYCKGFPGNRLDL